MAIPFAPVGGQSSPTYSRGIERVFEDAQHTGELHLSSKNLKEYPKIASNYDCADMMSVDLSKNRLSEMPAQLLHMKQSLEQLNCYQNLIKAIPQSISQLQSLVWLNLSRNQLSNIPPMICQLQRLEVLLASNNHLLSLPEEIGRLDNLMQLDVSCNEITHLPTQIGDMSSLKDLNVRRNLLVELPNEISRLSLEKLDFSGNKISHIPHQFRHMDRLDELILHGNPLVSPPTKLCSQGRVHIMKYLRAQAIKEDRKRGILSQADMRSPYIKTPQKTASSSDYANPAVQHQRPVDSGYSTADSHDRWQWSASQQVSASDSQDPAQCKVSPRLTSHVAPQLTPQVTPAPVHQAIPPANHNEHSSVGGHPGATSTPISGVKRSGSDEQQDEFTLELQRQKTEYETRKAAAIALRHQIERQEIAQREERQQREEQDERRRAAVRLQEERTLMREQMLQDEQHREAWREGPSVPDSPGVASISSLSSLNSFGEYDQTFTTPTRCIANSESFKSDRRLERVPSYRRQLSESDVHSAGHSPGHGQSHCPAGSPPQPPIKHNSHMNGVCQVPNSNASTNGEVHEQSSPPQANFISPAEELRLRHEALLAQQRYEAQLVRRRIEEDKMWIRKIQKEAVYNFVNKRTHTSIRPGDEEEENGTYTDRGGSGGMHNSSFSYLETSSNLSTGSAASNSSGSTVTVSDNRCQSPLPVGCQRALEAMSTQLDNHDPAFTIRRQYQQYQEERDQVEQLRQMIETRLKVVLPDDLSLALRDGVVLCHLANHLRPRSVTSIFVPSPSLPKLTLAKCRKNVENFLDACVKIGVDKTRLCSETCILDESGAGTPQLADTIHALLECTALPNQSLV